MDKIKELENMYQELVDYFFSNDPELEKMNSKIFTLKDTMDKNEYEKRIKLIISIILSEKLLYFNNLVDVCQKDKEIKEIVLKRIEKCESILDRILSLNKDKKVVN